MLLRNAKRGGKDHDFLVDFAAHSVIIPNALPEAAGEHEISAM